MQCKISACSISPPRLVPASRGRGCRIVSAPDRAVPINRSRPPGFPRSDQALSNQARPFGPARRRVLISDRQRQRRGCGGSYRAIYVWPPQAAPNAKPSEAGLRWRGGAPSRCALRTSWSMEGGRVRRPAPTTFQADHSRTGKREGQAPPLRDGGEAFCARGRKKHNTPPAFSEKGHGGA